MYDPLTERTSIIRKTWTREQEEWLIAHKNLRGLEHVREEFMKAFPDANHTAASISSKRTELGAWGNRKQGGKKPCPLYSEHIKDGYVYIKVAKNEWWPKARWVWVASHPGEEFNIFTDLFIFLDGDRNNFRPDNIRKTSKKAIRLYNSYPISNDPLANDVLLTRMELKIMMLDRGEELGLVAHYGGNRKFKKDIMEYQRKYAAKIFEDKTEEEIKEFKKRQVKKNMRLCKEKKGGRPSVCTAPQRARKEESPEAKGKG